MLELARAGRWQQLPELDAQCDAAFRQLQDMDADDLSAQERARTLALALRIRADQEALQALTRPQFLRLARAVDGLPRPGGQ
jgi:flagellar protein FliT